MLRKFLILATLLLSISLLAFGTDLGSSFGAFFQSISPRPGANTATYSLSNGLVGYWTFDGKDTAWNSNTTQDKSGQGNTGTMISMSTTTSPKPGKLGQGFLFDGVDDFVSMGDPGSGALDFGTGSFSYSSWIKIGAIPVYHVAVSKKGDGAASSVGWFTFFEDTSSTMRAYISDGVDQVESSIPDSNFTDFAWHHLTVVVDRSSDMQIFYLDGVQKDADSVAVVGSVSNAISAIVGAAGFGGSPFNGILDDVRIYNRALSADEVKQLYLMGR